jgi:hypothetical protein
LTENASEQELTAAVLAWHGTVQEAHASFAQATRTLGGGSAWQAADATLSALRRLQAAIESQLPSAGTASPGSSSDPTGARVAP